MFPIHDPDVQYYKDFQRKFHTDIDEEVIFIGLKNSNGIFQIEFLRKVDTLTQYISKLNNIAKVYSLTNSSFISLHNGTFSAVPLIHINQPDQYLADSIQLFNSEEYRQLLISKKGTSIAIAAFNQPWLTHLQKQQLLYQIQKKLNDLEFNESHLAAKIRIETTYIEEIKKNIKIYLIISILIVVLALYFIFKSWNAIIIPLMIIFISNLWSLAIITICGYSVDVLTSLLPPVLSIICMSNIIHLSTKYNTLLSLGTSKEDALTRTFTELKGPTFFAALTTAVGILTLSITDILPIRTFGIFMGIGVLLSFAISYLFLQSYYNITTEPAPIHHNKHNKQWSLILNWSYSYVVKHKIKILAFTCLLMVVSLYYTFKIQINGSLLEEIPARNALLSDYKFIEDEFYGTRNFEMELGLQNSNDSLVNLERLREVEEIQGILQDSLNIACIISPLSLYKGTNKVFHGGNQSFFSLPSSQDQINDYILKINQTQYRDEWLRYYAEDLKSLRISGKLPDLTIKEFEGLSHRFEQYFNKLNFKNNYTYKFTGSSIIFDKIAYSLTNNLLNGLIIAFILIGLIGYYIMKSYRMVVISLIPNFLALLIMAGIMGLLGIHLKADTAIIFSISFGIAVDNTIHFLNRFNLELKSYNTISNALHRTFIEVGRPMMITTIILLLGFLSLLTSSFGGTFYIGLLISISLFFALILNLTILPILIWYFYKN
jgi:predicted RND superfamily exporter protein